MYDWYDPERRPPYVHVETYISNGVTYKVTYLVSNGYGGSISISSSTKRVEDEEENTERKFK